jgi:hypothetical protein
MLVEHVGYDATEVAPALIVRATESVRVTITQQNIIHHELIE